MIQFKTNHTYKAVSVCNRDAIWLYRITRRTAKTITIEGDFTDGSTMKTCRISIANNEETARPLGRYSMAPVLRAKNISLKTDNDTN